MNKPLIINLLGAPSAGKSTTRAGVFRLMKLAGYNVEETVEIAKGFTWEDRQTTLKCQPYIFSKQYRDLERLFDKVDFIVTDSPLILSYYYLHKYRLDFYPESLSTYILDQFNFCNNINFFIERVKPYNPIGRNQDEEGSNKIARELKEMLFKLNIPYMTVLGDEAADKEILRKVQSYLREIRGN